MVSFSLSIAAHRKWKFLPDDRAARGYAKRLGVEVGGTLGVLVLLVKHDILSLREANDLLSQMETLARYHSPVKNIDSLLD